MISPLSAQTTNIGHGRLEIRKIIVAIHHAGVDFPHLGQAFLVLRGTMDLKSGKIRCDHAFSLTSLTKERANPEHLLAIARGHWEIENRNHYVRDTTFAEDRSQTRTQNEPHMMATLKGLAISILCLIGIPEHRQGDPALRRQRP
ncbi:MAG: transposase [Acidithiobacillus sp.]